MVRILLNYGKCAPFIGIVTVIYHNLSAVKGRLVNAYVYVDIWTVLKTQLMAELHLAASKQSVLCFLFVMVYNEKIGHSFGKVI